jgi:hypothetical protein
MNVQNEGNPEPAREVQPTSRTRAETLILIRKVWPWIFLLLLVLNHKEFLRIKAGQLRPRSGNVKAPVDRSLLGIASLLPS